MSWYKRLWIFGLSVACGVATGYVATLLSQQLTNFMHDRLSQRFGAPNMYLNTTDDILGDAAYIRESKAVNYPDSIPYPDDLARSGHTLMSALQQLDRIQLYYDENPDPMFETPNLVNPKLHDEPLEFDD